jgi:hypothetical protein
VFQPKKRQKIRLLSVCTVESKMRQDDQNSSPKESQEGHQTESRPVPTESPTEGNETGIEAGGAIC